MATTPAGKPPESPPAFDPDDTSARDLRDQPLSVIKTELPALAQALGVSPGELFRSLAGETVQPETERTVREMRQNMMVQALASRWRVANRPVATATPGNSRGPGRREQEARHGGGHVVTVGRCRFLG